MTTTTIAARHIQKSLLLIIILAWLMAWHHPAQAKDEKRFTILHSSDEHSNLLPLPLTDYHKEKTNPSIGGFARLATIVKQERKNKAEEPVLLLSSGDFMGGSPFAWLILEGYAPELDIMQRIGYDAATIGNHEFDYGPDKLVSYLIRAGYPENHNKLPLLASNLVIPEGHLLNQVAFPEHKLIRLPNGLNIGIFGLLGPQAYSVAPAAKPVEISSFIEASRTQVEQLRAAGAEVVIALSHSGIADDRLLAESLDDLDIILGGHDHLITSEPEWINNTILMHSGYYLSHMGRIELAYDKATGTLRMINEDNNSPFLIQLNSDIPEDPEIAALIDTYADRLNHFLIEYTDSLVSDLAMPVVVSDFPLTTGAALEEHTVGNFLTDAMRLMAAEITGEPVDIAFQANGVIRANITPGTMPWSKGQVSFLDLATVSGLGAGPDGKAGYPLVSFYLTEAEIFTLLEIATLMHLLQGNTYFLQFSGLRYSYDPGKALWMRVPFLNLPVPAYRSVQQVELFEGAGMQSGAHYKTLNRDSVRLYHVVADHYLTSFLPMIGELLPRLKLELKNKQGEPVEVAQTIIMHQGREFKVWEALARYALSFEKNADGMSLMPETYRTTQNRILAENGMPLYAWSYALLILLLLLLIGLTRMLVISFKRS